LKPVLSLSKESSAVRGFSPLAGSIGSRPTGQAGFSRALVKNFRRPAIKSSAKKKLFCSNRASQKAIQ
jgi:hypothetical protein